MIRRLSLLFALVLCQYLVAAQETKYVKGKSYHYQYDAYILSGIPDISNDYSGYKITTMACLTYVSDAGNDRSFVLTLKKPKISLISGDVSPVFPDRGDRAAKLNRSSIFTDINGTEMVLKEPVVYTWTKEGHVKAIKTSSKDKNWSVNLKKGLLSMLCGCHRRVKSDKRTGAGLITWKEEDTVQGSCPTAYTYRYKGNNIFDVIQIRDLVGCKTRPFASYTSFRGRRCKNPYDQSIPYRKDRLKRESETRYDLRRTGNDDFFIEKAYSKGQYSYTPPGESRQFMATYVVQDLVFVRKVNGETVNTNKNTKNDNLIMLFSNLTKNTGLEEKTITLAHNTIINFLSKNKDSVKFNRELVVVAEYMSELSKAKLLKLLEMARKKKIGYALEGMIGSVGTIEANAAIIDLAKDPKVSDERARRMISSAAATGAYAEKLLNEFEKLSEESIMTTSKRTLTLQSLWLGIASLYNKLQMNATKETIATLSMRAGKFMAAQKKRTLSNISQDKQRLIMILGLGNSGLLPLKSELLKYLTNKYDLSVRLSACRAWRKFAPQAPQETRVLMFPIFADANEDIEMRIGAFLNLAKSRPSRFHMAVLAEHIRHERSIQVRSFMVSYLLTMSSLKKPSFCRAAMVANARWVIQSLPRNVLQVSPYQSRVFYFPVKGARWTSFYGAIIYARDSALPRCITIKMNAAVSDAEIEPLTLEFRSFGSQERLRKMLGPYGSLMESILALPKRAKSAYKSSGTGSRADRLFLRVSYFGEDVALVNEKARNFWKVARQVIQPTATFYLQDSTEIATTIGLSAMLDQYVVGARSSDYKATFEGKTTLTYKPTSTNFMQISLGTILRDTDAFVGMDASTSILPGGKTKLVFNAETKNTGVEVQFHLMSIYKNISLFSTQSRAYHAVTKNWVCCGGTKQRELTLLEPKIRTTDVYGERMGMPMVMTTLRSTNNKDATPIRKTRARQFAGSGGMKVPMMMSMYILQSKFCGVSFDISASAKKRVGRRMKRQSDDEEYIEEEEEIEADPGEPSDFEYRRANRKNTNYVEGPVTVKLRNTRYPVMMSKGTLRPYRPGFSLPSAISKLKTNIKLGLVGMKNKQMKTTPIGDIKMTLTNGTNNAIKTRLSIKLMKYVVSVMADMQTFGSLIYFDPTNPFRVTTNAEIGLSIKVKVGPKSILEVDRFNSMSESWIKNWKRMLSNPDSLARDWPDVYRCVQDIKRNSKHSNTPNCIRTWETLQTFNQWTYEMTYNPKLRPLVEQVFSAARPYFSEYQQSIEEEYAEFNATFNPTDSRAAQKRRWAMKMMSGWPYFSSCDIYVCNYTNKLIGKTFDSKAYEANLQASLFKGKSLILAQDRRFGTFTVTFTYKGTRQTHIHYRLKRKLCKIVVSTGGRVRATGAGCKDKMKKKTYKVVKDCYFAPYAVKVRVPSRRLTVHTTAGKIARITIGARYHDSIRGLCGNMDREPEVGELLGKSCNGKVFENEDNFAKDYVVTAPLSVKLCK